MGDKVKTFIQKLSLDSQEAHSKFTVQQIQQHMRPKRDTNGGKLFQTHEYPTLN